MDPTTGFCRGCWRTIEEIARWLSYGVDEKRRVLADVAARRSAAAATRI
jgi:hypothetical protein